MTKNSKEFRKFEFRILKLFRISDFVLRILFSAAGGTTGGGTASTGGTGSALKLSAAGKGKGRHHPLDSFAFALRANNFFGGLQYQFFEFVLALIAMILINRHFMGSFLNHRNIF